MEDRMQRALIIPGFLMLLALSGCATLPTGPSVMVLPAPGKPFEVFQSEDAACRRYAEQRVGMAPQDNYNQNAVSGAAVGTVLGAGVGALLALIVGHVRTAVTAAPCSDDSRMRRIALPSVMPKPRSSGSATMVAMRDGSAPGSTSSFSGLIRDCQFL